MVLFNIVHTYICAALTHIVVDDVHDIDAMMMIMMMIINHNALNVCLF